MIDRLLWWLACRPFSDRPWLEDVYVRASVLRWNRVQKRGRPVPKKTGPARNDSRRKENQPTG